MFHYDSYDAQGIKNLLDQGRKFTADELLEMLNMVLIEVIEGEGLSDKVECLESEAEALERDLDVLTVELEEAEETIQKLSM